MTKRRMAAITTLGSNISLQIGGDSSHQHHQGVAIEEIEGLIKVYRDGQVERPEIVPSVAPTLAPDFGVTSGDVVIDKLTNIWARFYVPMISQANYKLPLILYFHGGGFCVGSASWSCYHEFLARLAATSGCLIMSVNYRLAPENRLPAAYEDGNMSLMWLKQHALSGNAGDWWSRQCNFTNIFLAGDSAGANIAYNIATRLTSNKASEDVVLLKPLILKGTVLIQPFFGGEARTNSEKYLLQSPHSALSLAVSDTYWRLALPSGANRDHPWCNPLAKLEENLTMLPMLVCISEMDILKDRNLEFVGALCRAGNKRVKQVVHKGVGHAFQVLSKSQVSQTRTMEMMCQINGFISG